MLSDRSGLGVAATGVTRSDAALFAATGGVVAGGDGAGTTRGGGGAGERIGAGVGMGAGVGAGAGAAVGPEPNALARRAASGGLAFVIRRRGGGGVASGGSAGPSGTTGAGVTSSPSPAGARPDIRASRAAELRSSERIA
jgi:hypothetical protein